MPDHRVAGAVMPVEVACPGCGLKLKAPDTMAGKKAKCKKCATPFRVPGTPPPGESSGDEQLLSAMALPAPPSPADPPAPPARDVSRLPSADPFDFTAPAARPAPAPKPAPAAKATPIPPPAPKPVASPTPAPRPAFGSAKAAPPPPATPAPVKPGAKPKPAPARPEAEVLPLDDEAVSTTDTVSAAAADTTDPFSFNAPPAGDRAEPKRRRARDRDDEDDRPRSRRRDDDEGDRPRGRGRDRDDEDDRPRYRAGAQKSGNAMRYAVILGVLAVGAAVAAVVVYVKAKKEEEQARLKAEQEKNKKDDPPDVPKDDGKGGKTDPKKDPPKKDKEPKDPPAKKEPAAPAFALPAGTPPLGVRVPAPPGPVIQAPGDTKVAVGATADRVRQVFPGDEGSGRDTVVVSVSAGPGGKGQKVAVDTYGAATGAKGKGFGFDGDGNGVKCDVSPDGKLFAAAGPDGKVSVWTLADGAKVLDGFDPYAESPDHKKDGLAAVYFTRAPDRLLTVTTAGVVHLFDTAARRKVEVTRPSGVVLAPNRITRGRNVAVDETRSVVVLAAYGAVFRYDTGTLRELPGKITLGAEVTRPLALGVSVGAPGHLVFAFETDANSRKEKGLMLVDGKGADAAKLVPQFYRWPDAAGEAAAVDWMGDKLAVVTTTKGAMWVEYGADTKRLVPLALAEVPGGRAVHAATERDRHWYLIPDAARPTGSLLLSIAWPPNEFLEIRQDAAAGTPLHLLRLDDKGLSR